MADWTPESRVEEILYDTINGEEYNGLPESRIEELLLELKEVIEAGGGGGGGTTNYNLLENKPQIGGVTLSGNKTLDELGLSTELRKVMDMITGQFSTESDYSEGDIVIHDKTLYVFVTDHTAGQWNNLEVSQTTLEELIANAGGGSVKAFVKATPAMTSATTPSGVASASSEYNGSYAAWYAFCGTPGNDQQTWATSYGHTIGEWIQYKFDEGVVIKKIATTNRNEGNPRVIKKFIFQGSNDGETYVDLANCEVESNQGHYRQEFLINNDTAYTYYRLYVTEPWVSGDTTVGLAQLEIYKEIEVNITELGDLTDVNIHNASEGQPLIYDAASSQWVNTKVLSASYGGTGNSSGYIRAGVRENTTIGNRATAEGVNNTVSGENAHAEGQNNTASGVHSHVEGEQCQATEWWAHAEGFQSKAYGRVTHAEGNGTTASNYYAHSEGLMSTASGNTSHAEGSGTTASGASSHSQNESTVASGARSTAAGYYTNAGYENQFVVGKYNNNKNTSLLEVGNGADAYNRSNALELDASGNLKVSGTVTDGNGNVLGGGNFVKYGIVTKSTGGQTASITINKYINDVLDSSTDYGYSEVVTPVVIDGYFQLTYSPTDFDWSYTLLKDSQSGHAAGYTTSWRYSDEINTEESFDLDVSSLANLSDVIISSLTNGQILKYNSTSGVWENDDAPDLSNYVQTSQTSGLLKNDGTVDTTVYASEAGTESLISSTVGWTGKNLLPSTAVSQSFKGVTFTVNADKSITLEDSATSNFAYVVFEGSITIPSNCRFSIGTIRHASTQIQVLVNGDTYYIPADKEYVDIPAGTLTRCRIDGNQYFSTQTPITYYPMVYSKSIVDPTYEPYHKSVEECLEEINDKLSYLEQTVTLSTSASTTVTFTDSSITANSFIEYACSQWDLVPESITGAAGSCTIVLPKVDSAQSVTVRIYVR